MFHGTIAGRVYNEGARFCRDGLSADRRSEGRRRTGERFSDGAVGLCGSPIYSVFVANIFELAVFGVLKWRMQI